MATSVTGRGSLPPRYVGSEPQVGPGVGRHVTVKLSTPVGHLRVTKFEAYVAAAGKIYNSLLDRGLLDPRLTVVDPSRKKPFQQTAAFAGPRFSVLSEEDLLAKLSVGPTPLPPTSISRL